MPQRNIQKKIILICVYFGKLPKWINFYIETCKYNSSIDWIIFTDAKIPSAQSNNFRFIKIKLLEFSALVNKKLNLEIDLRYPYKICDLKPAYGAIFEDFITPYDFWGHVDLDILWGDIRKFVTDEILERHQIISAFKYYICGHFTLYKNSDEINNLYTGVDNFKKILEDYNIHRFDEDIFSKTVHDAIEEKRISVFMNNLNITDTVNIIWHNQFMPNLNLSGMKIGAAYWKDGKIFFSKNNEEAVYFHFQIWKLRKERFVLPCIKVPRTIKGIEINENGFKIHCSSFLESGKCFTKYLIERMLIVLRLYRAIRAIRIMMVRLKN